MLSFVRVVKEELEEGNEEAVPTDVAQSQENSLVASAKNCTRNVRTATNMERMGMPGCGSIRIKRTEKGCKHGKCSWHTDVVPRAQLPEDSRYAHIS